MNETDVFLEHYGIKGMHWGVVRRAVLGGAVGLAATKPKPKPVKTSSTERTKYKTAPAKLTTDELTRRIVRMEKEKRYNELNANSSVTAGKKLASEVLTQNGKQLINMAFMGAGMFAVKKAVDAIWGEGTADTVYSPNKKKK